MELSIKQDDTAPAVTISCAWVDAQGYTFTVPDFTGAAATFAMRDSAGTVIINDVAATLIPSATDPQATYTWVAGDTATAGDYEGEFHITLASGKRVTFPSADYLIIHILDDI